MPNRVIREALLDSDRYVTLAHDSERLMFIELLLCADDFGLVPMNFAFLRRRISPCAGKTESQVEGMVLKLADNDLVRLYHSESGARFGWIPRFGNAPRAIKPKWPMPPKNQAFSEINNLAQNCIASARKRASNAHQAQTNAPETETETETETASLRSVVEPAQADSPPPAKPKRSAKPKVIISRSELLALGINEDDLDSWLTRRGSRSPVTKAVLADHEREAQAAGLTLPQAIAYAAGKGWVAFNAAWYANARRVSSAIGRQAGAPAHRGPKLGKADFVEGMEDGIAF